MQTMLVAFEGLASEWVGVNRKRQKYFNGVHKMRGWTTTSVKARAGRGTQHRTGEMNKLEAAYAEYLQGLKLAGEICDYAFESVKLRLANNTFYSPDFAVIKADHTIEMHEVKGFWEEDARVKIKVAAEQHPFKFIGIQRKRGEWIREEF
jgi:hypothetical protein